MSGLARNRLLSALVATLTTSGLIALVESPEARVHTAYAVIATLGYGHLFAAARPLEGFRRWTPPGASPWLAAAFLAVSISTAYVAYRGLLAAEPRAIALLFALSAWHSWENDRALPLAYARRGLPGPTRASPWTALAVAASAVAAAPFLFGPTGGALEVAIFVLPTAYHLASWLVLSLDRLGWLRAAGHPAASRRLRRRLLGCHSLALLPAVVTLAAPESSLALITGAFLSLPIYLFATALHIVDTSAKRGWQLAPAAP